MDNRSVGSRGSLYPHLKKGETGSLDAPEAVEVFSKGRVTGGRTKRSRTRSPGPIGLQIDPSHLETFDRNDDYVVGLYLDDGDGELMPSGPGAHTSTGSVDNFSDSNGLLNLLDDSFIDNRSTGSYYGEVDLNDNDLKPSASPRKGSRSRDVARQTQQDADSRSEDGSRSARSTRSAHTNPGVLLNDKAQRTRKTAPKQMTAAERLAQYGATITKVRSAGSMHGAGALHAHCRPAETVDPSSGVSANAVWGQGGNVGTSNISQQSPSLVQGQAEPAGPEMPTDSTPLPVKHKSMTSATLNFGRLKISKQSPSSVQGQAEPAEPGMPKEETTFPVKHKSMTSATQNFFGLAGRSKPPKTGNSPYDPQRLSTGNAKNSVHIEPSANARAGVGTISSGSRDIGVSRIAQKPVVLPPINDSQPRSHLKPTPKPLETHRVAPFLQSTGNKQVPLSGSRAQTQQQEMHLGTQRSHVGDTNMYNPDFAPGPAPPKSATTQSHIGIPPSAHVDMVGRMESSSIPPLQMQTSMMTPSPQVVVPTLGQNEHDKFQNAMKHLKSTPATSQAPRQGTQTAALKTPPVEAGVPFHQQYPIEQQRGGPGQLPRLDHTTSQSVHQRYPTNQQNPTTSPMTKEQMPTPTWGRSPLAANANVSKKGHSIIDNGANNRMRTYGPLDSLSPPPPPSVAAKKSKEKNIETDKSKGNPKKSSSFGSLGALVGGIRRGKHD